MALIVSANLNNNREIKPKFADLVTNQILSPDSANTFGENLKVLHGIHSREQLIGVMRGFSEALGVKCDFCHAAGNFASDEKAEKRTARLMVRLVSNVDNNYFAGPQMEKVTCFTCHRGSSVPKMAASK
jgi:Cu2+-containing amine oxidase